MKGDVQYCYFFAEVFLQHLYLKHVINNYVISKLFGSGLKTQRFAES